MSRNKEAQQQKNRLPLHHNIKKVNKEKTLTLCACNVWLLWQTGHTVISLCSTFLWSTLSSQIGFFLTTGLTFIISFQHFLPLPNRQPAWWALAFAPCWRGRRRKATCEAWKQTIASKHSHGVLHPLPEKDAIFSHLLPDSICLTTSACDVSVNCQLWTPGALPAPVRSWLLCSYRRMKWTYNG